jgi:hypothetical protein
MTTESGNYFPKRLDERADLNSAYCGGCKSTDEMSLEPRAAFPKTYKVEVV